MTNKLYNFVNRYNGAIRLISKKKHSNKTLEKISCNLRLPEGVTYNQLKEDMRYDGF